MSEVAERRPRSLLVTGAGGYIGRQFVAALVEAGTDFDALVALDVRVRGLRLFGTWLEKRPITCRR